MIAPTLLRTGFCKKCNQDTPRYKDRSCIICKKKTSAAWYKRNPERVTKKSASWFKNHPGKRKQCDAKWYKRNMLKARGNNARYRMKNPGTILNYYYLKKYGIDRETYEGMFKEQNGVCYVCQKPETRKLHGKPSRLSVDHCHKTGAVRKLLCARCNQILGQVHEDSDLLRLLADYLEGIRRG